MRICPKKENELKSKTDTRDLWHARLGHASSTTIENTTPIVKGIYFVKFNIDGICQTCELAKSKPQSRSERSLD